TLSALPSGRSLDGVAWPHRFLCRGPRATMAEPGPDIGRPGRVPTMAKRVVHELIDDINGQPADESITFGLDGVQYKIDLTSKNAAKLRDVLAPFVTAGTKVGRGGVTGARGRDG